MHTANSCVTVTSVPAEYTIYVIKLVVESFIIHVPPSWPNMLTFYIQTGRQPAIHRQRHSRTTQPILIATVNIIPNSSYLLTLSRKVQDLPYFDGRHEDWPMFATAFAPSTAPYNYTNFEKNQRLQRCLKGEARETVHSLIIHLDNVPAIIDTLGFRFGRPKITH
nr:uncharacterized protein LOC106621939 isoform X1 [Bactrocera oleae]